MTWLVSEFDHRDPDNKLTDIDTGRYLEALGELPDSIRQMMQDGDLHVDVQEIDGHWRVTKIVKKREPEYLQGSDQYFITDDEGRRIPVSEDELDQMLGIQHDPEDLFNREEIERHPFEHAHTCPRDVWDVIFDASDHVKHCQRLIEDDDWQAQPLWRKKADIAQSEQENLYSADWFYYPVDKRLRTQRAREIAKCIEQGVSKRQLSSLLGPKSTDKRPEIAKSLRVKASKMRHGKQKAAILVRAQKIVDQYISDRRHGRTRTPISSSERKRLWELWREREMRVNGSVQLTHWQFKAAYQHKLNRQVSRGEITREEASERLSERLRSLYRAEGRFQPKTSHETPSWLRDVPQSTDQQPADDYQFTGGDWLEVGPIQDEYLDDDSTQEQFLLEE